MLNASNAHDPLPKGQGQSRMLMNQQLAVTAYSQTSVGNKSKLAENDLRMKRIEGVGFLENEILNCRQIQTHAARQVVKADESDDRASYEFWMDRFLTAGKRLCYLNAIIHDIQALIQEGGEG